MTVKVDQVSFETKWGMAAMGLTNALTAHLNTIYNLVGRERYAGIVRDLWALMGKATAEGSADLGLTGEDARSVARAGATMCICSMGPELKIEEIEAGEDRTIMKITGCPWKNRMVESGISHDLLTPCDVAFWKHFVKHINPNVTMKHGKQMHRGDPYCEWIFETRKRDGS